MKNKKVIGIPRAMSYYNYFPFWYGFFNSLDIEIVLSAPTTKKTISDGASLVVTETCLPVKVYVGHILNLLEKGVENINLVTPTSYVLHIIEAIKIAKNKGLQIPIVYNTNGYENVETLKLLEGYVDVYLPDLKYYYKEDYVSQVTYLTYLNNEEDFDINNILILSEGNLVPLEEYSPIVKGLLHSGAKKETRIFYGVKNGGVKKYV